MRYYLRLRKKYIRLMQTLWANKEIRMASRRINAVLDVGTSTPKEALRIKRNMKNSINTAVKMIKPKVEATIKRMT